MTPPHTLIVGSGYTGLSAAHELAKKGHRVTILEADTEIGGLAGTFELSPGVRLEKFYHHWFSSDRAIIEFIHELGLGDSLVAKESNTGLYYANSIFRLSSPFDLLTFPGIPLLDRIRTGIMALLARRMNDVKALEEMSASEWLIRYGGKKAYEVIWRPLLQGKFGSEAEHISAVWIWNKLKLRGGSRGEKGKETLLYFNGGFGALTDSMRAALEKKGITIRTNTPVRELLVENGAVVGVKTDTEMLNADKVLVTTPLPIFLEMAKNIDLPSAWRDIRFLGNVCVVLRLKQSLSNTYWLNIADPTFPFVGIIEHTNFDDKSHYNGEHIAYLSKYMPTSDPLFQLSDSEYVEYCLPFVQRIFPAFQRDWLIGTHVWRAQYSQPVITKRYSSFLPPQQMPVKSLWLATMAQVYPEDRGTNYAVRLGREVAESIAR